MNFTHIIFLSAILCSLSCRDAKEDTSPEPTQQIDFDQDGFFAGEDCDDTNPAIFPGALEACDAVDNNCDGQVDEGVVFSFYFDEDGDGFGDPDIEVEACEPPNGYVSLDTDCDDENAEIYPSAVETCNEIDDDCDGETDEDLFSGLYYDGDGDGHGDPNQPSEDCSGGQGYVYYNDDCNDSNAQIYPFAEEVCDEIDNDCDGAIDENVTTTFYADVDGDGFGDQENTTEACQVPEGYSENEVDCDDGDASQYPGAPEYCNAEDDDCDTVVDNDPVDSPTWYYDIDEDGYGSAFIIALECEAPLGYVSSNTDCDDTKPTVYPGATEYCNNLDNDCNGDIDDNAVDAFYWYADLDRDDFGDATDSVYQCEQPFSYILDANDCDDGDSDIHPDAEELCNGRDDNCDGAVDNDTTDFLVYYLDADGDGFGDPNTEIEDCELPSGYVVDNTDCNDTDALIHPDAEEDCDGVDQNCSGMNFYEQDLNSDGYLACETSLWVRNNFANNTSPYSASSQAADLLLSMGITISEAYHAHTSINQALLENTGLYVHHGMNSNGAIGAYTNAEANAIRTWVYDGGRMLYIGYDSSHGACEIADSLPSQFGVSCDPNYVGWSGSSTSFTSHPITSGLTEIGGNGGDNWVVSAPAETLVSVNGNPFVIVSEYGDGKVVIVSNQWPYLNSGSGYRINFADNQVLVGNIWQWLLD